LGEAYYRKNAQAVFLLLIQLRFSVALRISLYLN
jgi:hypothetical protein